ncbi:MAG: serine hydrolase domain-containing protein [Bryobacteraceae bacterium]
MPLRIPFFAGLVIFVAPAFPQLKPGPPAGVGISAARLAVAASLLESEVKNRGLGAASILVARRGTIVLHKAFGKAEPDSIYLIASITKPVTASALMLLVEQGQVGLEESVTRYLPEFTGGDRPKVRVRDLLTHSSGLPDMLPENVELRKSNAPLSEYVKRVYSTPLLYKPGTEYRYQSMGILLAAEIVEKLTGTPLREFETTRIFDPLQMRHTFLGLGPLKIEDTISAWVPPNAAPDEIETWGHNSPLRPNSPPWCVLRAAARLKIWIAPPGTFCDFFPRWSQNHESP